MPSRLSLGEAVTGWNALSDVDKVRLACYAILPGSASSHVRTHCWEQLGCISRSDLFWTPVSAPRSTMHEEALTISWTLKSHIPKVNPSLRSCPWMLARTTLARLSLLGADMTVISAMVRYAEARANRDS